MATVDLGKVAIKHKGNWSSATTYEPLDFVYYETDGCGYIALVSNTNVTPGTDATKWALSVHAGGSGTSAVKTKVTYSSSDTAVASMAWDSMHVFPEMASLTFTLASVPVDSDEHQVVVIFDTPADVTNFSLTPDGSILWAGGGNPALNIVASTRYEININSGSMIGVYTMATLPSQ